MAQIWHRVNTVLLILLLLAVVSVIAMLATGVRGGPLDPQGAPASTYKTLQEVEPRTPVQSLAGSPTAVHVISAPGSYYLTRDVNGVSGKDGIEISSDDVTLDLNGFTVRGGPSTLVGIAAIGGVRNVTLRNGTVREWVSEGVAMDAFNVIIESIRASNNSGSGIDIGYGATIRDSVAFENGAYGIRTNETVMVTNVVAKSNVLSGIRLGHHSVLVNCIVENNYQYGIDAGTGVGIKGCTATNNGWGGINAGVDAMISDNQVTLNGWDPNVVAAAITFYDNSRVEGNNVLENEYGVRANGENSLVIANNATGNPSGNYVIDPGNTVGPIIPGPVDPIASANPWANFSQ